MLFLSMGPKIVAIPRTDTSKQLKKTTHLFIPSITELNWFTLTPFVSLGDVAAPVAGRYG